MNISTAIYSIIAVRTIGRSRVISFSIFRSGTYWAFSLLNIISSKFFTLSFWDRFQDWLRSTLQSMSIVILDLFLQIWRASSDGRFFIFAGFARTC